MQKLVANIVIYTSFYNLDVCLFAYFDPPSIFSPLSVKCLELANTTDQGSVLKLVHTDYEHLPELWQ